MARYIVRLQVGNGHRAEIELRHMDPLLQLITAMERHPGQRGLFNEAEAAVEILEAAGVDAPLIATPLRDDKAPPSATHRSAS